MGEDKNHDIIDCKLFFSCWYTAIQEFSLWLCKEPHLPNYTDIHGSQIFVNEFQRLDTERGMILMLWVMVCREHNIAKILLWC